MKLFFMIGFLFLLGCKETDDKAEIRALFAEVAEAAQKHDVAGMMEHATKDFEAHPGAREQSEVRPALFIMLKRFGNFQVKYPSISPDISADALTATVKVPIVIAQNQPKEDGLEEGGEDIEAWADAMRAKFGDPYYFEFRLKKVSGKWKVWQAHVTGTHSVL